MDFLTEILSIIVKAIIENAGTVIAFLITTILSIIGTYYGVKNYFLRKKEAEKAPRIKISLYHQNVEEVYFVLPFKSHRKFIIPLHLTIENEGSLSAKDVEVFMEMNESLYGRYIQRKASNIASAKNVVFAAEEGRSKYMTTSYVKVGNLPPGQSVLVGPEISIDTTTVLDVPVEATTKDDVKIKINIRTVVAFVLNIKVIYENARPINKDLRIQFRKGSAKRLEQFLAEEGKLIQELSRPEERVSIPRCFIFFEEYECVGDKAGYRFYRAKYNSVKVIIRQYTGWPK